MGGKGGGDQQYQAPPGFDRDEYLKQNPDVAASGMDPVKHFYLHGQFENRPGTGQEPPPDPFAGFHFPSRSSGGFHQGSGSDANAIAEQNRLIEGQNSRDEAYGFYLDAAEQATDFINNQIAEEQSNAALLGIEYNIDDEAKTNRINNYFASIWSEGDQRKLKGLFRDFGNPEGFKGFKIKRGDSGAGSKEKADDKSIATSGGVRPPKTNSLATSEDDLLAGGGALG